MFDSVEFYVITAFVAAAVIAAVAMPPRRAAARDFLYAGDLVFDASPSVPGIVVIVGDDGVLTIYRFGLSGVSASGAFSIAVSIVGFDVTVNERLTEGNPADTQATAATVRLDCFGAERYHFHYVSERLGRSAAFSLNIRPGNRIDRRLD